MRVTLQNARPIWAALIACALGTLSPLAAQAQGAASPATPAPGAVGAANTAVPAAPAAPDASGAATPAAPPPAAVIGRLLGTADFLIAIDRPYDAENLYRAVLQQDPTNTEAQAGLQRAIGAQEPEATLLFHNYQNDLGPHAHMVTYGGGPTFHTPSGDITFWVGDGDYRQAGEHLRKSTLDLIADPRYKDYDLYTFLSGVKYYGAAPDRFLYNVRLSYLPQPTRERYTLISQREDSFLQSNNSQFFAPDSIFSIKEGLILQQTGFEIEHGIGDKVDLLPSYSHYSYSDGNRRDLATLQALYRILPAPQMAMPVFRVGLQYMYDDTKNPAYIYYAPVHFQSLSLAADYVQITRRLKYGLIGTYGVTGESGDDGGRYAPPKLLYAFVNYNISDPTELVLKFTDVASPQGSPSFTDAVFEVNQRF